MFLPSVFLKIICFLGKVMGKDNAVAGQYSAACYQTAVQNGVQFVDLYTPMMTEHVSTAICCSYLFGELNDCLCV